MIDTTKKKMRFDWRWWLTALLVSATAAGAGFAAGMWLGR